MPFSNDARARIAAALDLLPTGNLLTAVAVAIHDQVWKDGRTHSCGHGLVVAERINVTPAAGGVETMSGLRLVVLRNRTLLQQKLSGSRTAEWQEWTAPAAIVPLEQIVDTWSADEVIAGIEQIVERCKARPEKAIRTLESAQKRLAELRSR